MGRDRGRLYAMARLGTAGHHALRVDRHPRRAASVARLGRPRDRITAPVTPTSGLVRCEAASACFRTRQTSPILMWESYRLRAIRLPHQDRRVLPGSSGGGGLGGGIWRAAPTRMDRAEVTITRSKIICMVTMARAPWLTAVMSPKP